MASHTSWGAVRLISLILLLDLAACGGGNSGTGSTTCEAGFYGANCTCTAGPQVTIDFRSMGTTIVPSLIAGDVFVTGSSDLGLLDLNGLGIVGGLNNYLVDGVEFVNFTFTAPVVEVAYYVSQAGNLDGDMLVGEAFVEVFDTTSTSLGSFPVNDVSWKYVSDLVGGQTPISAFTATADVDSFQVSYLRYSLLGCP